MRAVSSFSTATQAFARGDASREAGKEKEANAHYEKALSHFEAAELDAISALAEAGDSQRKAQRLLPVCKGKPTQAIRSECTKARSEISRGEKALAAEDAPTAIAAYEAANSALTSAKAIESEAKKPKPVSGPVIQARTPKTDKLEIAHGRPIRLSVKAKDGSGGPLRYAWNFDGKPLKGTDAGIELRPERNGRVTVTVAGSGKKQASASWQVSLTKNNPPTLSLTPGSAEVRLEVGKSRDFVAKATDPDGDRVNVVYKLDGKRVGKGDSYRFSAKTEGRHVLEVLASDPQGAAAPSVKKTIVVAAVQRQKPIPAVQRPGGKKMKKELVDALAQYERAFESCNVSKLEQIWVMQGPEKLAYQTICENFAPLRVTAKATEKHSVKGDQALVCYSLNAISKGSGTPVIPNQVMTGTMVDRGDGWQFIRIRKGCNL